MYVESPLSLLSHIKRLDDGPWADISSRKSRRRCIKRRVLIPRTRADMTVKTLFFPSPVHVAINPPRSRSLFSLPQECHADEGRNKIDKEQARSRE
jgi:hypothetical protein